MPAKKEAIVLQKEVCNQEQWDDIMATEGLFVVDVYQRWCGPCTAVVSLFKRLKNEIGDDLLKFAIAEADNIENLERYRGHCEPCFLFFGGGQLVDVIRGANGPGLQKSVMTQLAAEHRVLEEGAERKVIKDPLLAAMEAKEQAALEADAAEKRKQEEEAQIGEIISGETKCEDVSVRPVSENTVQHMFSEIQDQGSRSRVGTEPVPKEVTVVLVKPDAVREGKVEEIIQKLVENGLEVLAQEEKTLTEDEAKEFYKEHEEEEHFDSLVQFMSSGPSHILVLTKGDTGEGVVHEVRALIGPTDVEVAKEEAPESLRAIFGTDKTMNALHGADSGERAARELSFFFPNFAVPIVPGTGPPPQVQKTLALIRPDALKEHKDAILEKIKASGFDVCLQKEIQLTEEQAKDFYKQQEGQPHFDELIHHMTSGPVLALGLAKEEAIQNWRNMLGPKEVEVAKQEAPDSLRAQFSLPDATINCVHGSDSMESAQKELNYFFPTEHTLAVIKPDASVEHKDAIIERIHEAGFNIACQKSVELDRELAEQLYREHEGKEFFDSLLDHMTSGPSMIMVLSREDAVQGWRTVMGPTDPDMARDQAPESLRALLGKDVLHNAIHGSSNRDSAKSKIQQFFPEVEIAGDGSITDMDVQTAGAVTDETTQDQQELPSAAAEQEEGEAPAEQGGEGEETPAEAAATEDSQQEGEEPQGGEGESPGEGEAQAPEGGDGDQADTQTQEVVGGEGEGEGEGGESAQAEQGGDEQPSVEDSKDEQTTDEPANQEGQEAEPSEEVQEQAQADDEQAEAPEAPADEGGEPQAQEEPSTEPASEEAQEQAEQPAAEQTDGEAGDGAGEQAAEEPAAEQAPAAAEDTPAAEDAPAAEEQQQAGEDKPAEEPTATAEQSEDKPSEEPASEQQEAAPTEGGEQEPEQKEEQPPEGGDEQKEGPAAEGGDQQKEEPAAEGGDQQKEEPTAKGGEEKKEEPAEES